jgi:hypothetical protein
MAISHRTNRLKLIGTPAVEQLQNGRYKLTITCSSINSREDWYSSNKARIFPDFGSLESAEMSIDGLAPRTGEAYTDMRLTEVQSGNRSPRDGSDYIVVLTYETLGDSFVQVKDDNVNYIENGLRRVTRKSIAKAGTDFQKTVGTTSITSQIDTETEVTCVLANYEVDDTDSYREVTEVYIQAGTLSETKDKVGSQLSIVKETFASTPSAISGYSIANERESNVDGIPTKQFTFLKDSVELSRNEDKVGSQLAIVTEVFNPSSNPTESGYSVARTEVSDVNGIPTKRFTFLKDDVKLSESEDKVGSQNAITEQWFKPSASRDQKINYSLARKEESDVEGIPTERYTFLKDNVILSETEDKVGSQLAIVKEVFNGTPSSPSGYSLADSQTSDVNGIPTRRFRFLKNNVVLSESKDKVGSQLAITQEVFNGTPSPPSGYSVASEQESNVVGVPTKRFTFLKNNVQLSQSEDKVGSQLAISQQWFNPSEDKTVSGYSLASQNTSDFEGIETTEYRFLKEDVQLSQSEDEVGSQNSITEEWFKPSASRKTKTNYSLARKDESNVQGIPTERYTFLKDNVVLSVSEDRVGSQLAITNEVFKPDDDAFGGKNISGVALSGYSEASREKSNFQGIPTLRYRFLKNNVVLSETQDKVGGQLAVVKEVFNGIPSPPSGYSTANEQESNVGGISTKRFTFLKPNILSVTQDFNDGQKRVSVQAFNKTSSEVTSALSEVTSEHKLISQRESDFAGIKTSTFEYQLDESSIQDRELNGLNRIRLLELSASDFTAQTIGAVSSTAPTSGLFLGSQVIDNGGAIKTRESVWLQSGTLSVSTKNLAEGVKQVTTVFLVTEGSTVGPVTARSTSNFQGLKTISVTTMQDKSGNALGTAGTIPVHSFEVFSNFTYPGLFVPSSSVGGQIGNLQIELTKAPAQSKVRSTVYVFFTKTSTIESSDYKYDSAVGLWSPNDWGAVSVTAAGGTGVFNTSKALRGYRTDVDTFSGSIPASFGNFAKFLFQGSLKVTATPSIGFIATINKGPSNPVGSKWVLDVKIAAAFDDVDGTTYYKKTIIVTEAIPAQASSVGGPYD